MCYSCLILCFCCITLKTSYKVDNENKIGIFLKIGKLPAAANFNTLKSAVFDANVQNLRNFSKIQIFLPNYAGCADKKIKLKQT